MPVEREISVEVCYARADVQAVSTVKIASGASVGEAIRRSGLLERFPEIDLKSNAVGVFGKKAALDRPLADGERVEIYRPLVADPKEVRRKLAAQGRTLGKPKA
ncbi:MAG TPA: RnfH family protein [Gammaproteobacteria bacterium]|nr:RnfH family protein [Gammaproteobacteria bacterium]